MNAETAVAVKEDPRLAQALALVDALRTGNESAVAEIVEDLVQIRQTELFQEVGKLTRALHDALTSFRSDSRLSSLASEDIPDAKDRLKHVITMTEQAATSTLASIEKCKPLCDDLVQQAGELAGRWQQFRERRMDVNEFRRLSQHLDGFLGGVGKNAASVSHELSEMLMAQTFQDLTGQIIRRVISLVEEVEQSLINMVRLSGGVAPAASDARSSKPALEGPQVPGRMSSDAVSGQDEVDSLLSSLGF